MCAASALPLITCEQFFELPDPTGDFTYELHFGELVPVGRPKKRHYNLQRIIRDILAGSLDAERWIVDLELPYGLTHGYDARAADVGVVSRTVWNAVPDEGFLIGSPELVVSIKSRSNRDRKMEEDAIIHITHGATAVLLVKPDRREIISVTATARTVHGAGASIALPAPLSITIAVDDIFA